MATTTKKKPATKKPTKSAPKSKRKSPVKDDAADANIVNIIRTDVFTKELTKIESRFDFVASRLIKRGRTSTGLLAFDLQWSGGMLPGMYQISGQEHSGKTTAVQSIFGHCLGYDLPFNVNFDAEGTFGGDPMWTESVVGKAAMEMVRGGKTGAGFPISIYQDNIIEEVYNYIRAILKIFPDKIYDPSLERWMYRITSPTSTVGKNMLSLFDNNVEKITRDKKIYIPAPDRVEGIFVIDSYAAMVTDAMDEAEVRSKQQSQEARAFSENIKRVVAPLAKKGVAILGVNQIREKPGMVMGSPLYEPGGNALRFYSSCRDRIFALAPSSIKVPGYWAEKGEDETSAFGKEKSVEGNGYDYYQYSRVTNTKNKNGIPRKITYVRYWVRDYKDRGRGICPVFDTWVFLSKTGKAEIYKPVRKEPHIKTDLLPQEVTWSQFKALILAEVSGDKKRLSETSKACGSSKPIYLRKRCFEMVKKKFS